MARNLIGCTLLSMQRLGVSLFNPFNCPAIRRF